MPAAACRAVLRVGTTAPSPDPRLPGGSPLTMAQSPWTPISILDNYAQDVRELSVGPLPFSPPLVQTRMLPTTSAPYLAVSMCQHSSVPTLACMPWSYSSTAQHEYSHMHSPQRTSNPHNLDSNVVHNLDSTVVHSSRDQRAVYHTHVSVASNSFSLNVIRMCRTFISAAIRRHPCHLTHHRPHCKGKPTGQPLPRCQQLLLCPAAAQAAQPPP